MKNAPPLVDGGAEVVQQINQQRGFCTDFSSSSINKLRSSQRKRLLAINEGRKTLEEIREAGRLRVAKHRATKRDVTEKDSVTSETRTDGKARKLPALRKQPAHRLRAAMAAFGCHVVEAIPESDVSKPYRSSPRRRSNTTSRSKTAKKSPSKTILNPRNIVKLFSSERQMLCRSPSIPAPSMTK
jgi:hypothetical protein